MLLSRVRTFASDHPKEAERFIKFAAVGTAGAVTHFAIFNIAQALSVPILVANTLGFIAAVVQNFGLNRIWTFPESRSRARGGQLFQFAIVSVVGLIINQGVLLLCRYAFRPFWVDQLESESLALWVNDNFALAVAIGVVLFWNFLANRFWTYRGL